MLSIGSHEQEHMSEDETNRRRTRGKEELVGILELLMMQHKDCSDLEVGNMKLHRLQQICDLAVGQRPLSPSAPSIWRSVQTVVRVDVVQKAWKQVQPPAVWPDVKATRNWLETEKCPCLEEPSSYISPNETDKVRVLMWLYSWRSVY